MLIGEGNDFIIYILLTEFETRYEQDFARPAVKLVTETLRLNDFLAVSTCEYAQLLSLSTVSIFRHTSPPLRFLASPSPPRSCMFLSTRFFYRKTQLILTISVFFTSVVCLWAFGKLAAGALFFIVKIFVTRMCLPVDFFLLLSSYWQLFSNY
jgi:hypothetical protein